MKITFINPTRADINAQLALIKPAFDGVQLAKEEYQYCCESVRNRQAGLYQIKGNGVDVRFVGIVTEDNGYLVLALTGRGYVAAVEQIIDVVKGQGYRFIRCHTVRPGVVRLLRRVGAQVKAQAHDTVLTLLLEGC